MTTIRSANYMRKIPRNVEGIEFYTPPLRLPQKLGESTAVVENTYYTIRAVDSYGFVDGPVECRFLNESEANSLAALMSKHSDTDRFEVFVEKTYQSFPTED